MDTAPAEIADEIRAAFAGVEQPTPPLTLGEGPFEHRVEETLADKSADELTPDDALAVRNDLWALTPDAFRYYVPALIRMLLIGGTEVDALGEGIVTALTPADAPETRAKFDERMASLDEAQRRALGDFVCWWLSDEDEYVAQRDKLAAYWQCS
jgi:hypothetical protein